mgnify:CR=1 FL=1
MDEPRFRRLIGDADAHMANAFCTKIAYHQRVKFTYTALGTRPVYIHPHTQLLSIAAAVIAGSVGNRPAGRDQ